MKAAQYTLRHSENPVVFFDISIGGFPAGTIKIELFADVVPKVTFNLANLCRLLKTSASFALESTGWTTSQWATRTASFIEWLRISWSRAVTSSTTTAQVQCASMEVNTLMMRISLSNTISLACSRWQTLDQTRTAPSSSLLAKKQTGLMESMLYSAGW